MWLLTVRVQGFSQLDETVILGPIKEQHWILSLEAQPSAGHIQGTLCQRGKISEILDWRCGPMVISTNSSTAWESWVLALASLSCVTFCKLLNFSESQSHYVKTELMLILLFFFNYSCVQYYMLQVYNIVIHNF